MKRLTLSALILLAVFALSANSWNTLSLQRVHIPPTYAGLTFYDYHAGAYSGYPIRLQEPSAVTDPGNPRAAVLTFMKTTNPATVRRQVRTVLRYEPNPADPTDLLLGTDSVNINSWGVHEGFGTMAMDEGTGTPIFAWHAWQGTTGTPPATLNADVFITTEMNALMENEFSGSFTEPYKVIDNEAENAEVSWQWPLVHIGPSPIAGKKRVYVFCSNSGRTPYMKSTLASTETVPSSAEIFTYTDVDEGFFMNGLSFDPNDPQNVAIGYDLEWSTPQVIPFFWAMHMYNPNDHPHVQGDTNNPYIRTAGSVIVQKDGPGIAYAGELNGGFYEDTMWPGASYGEGEFYVAYNNNYGHPDNWHYYTFDLSSRDRISTENGFAHFWTTPEHSDSDTDYYWDLVGAGDHVDYDLFRNEPWGLYRKNIFFDDDGNINFPYVMTSNYKAVGATHDVDNRGGYWHPTAAAIWMAKFDPSNLINPAISVFPISPRPEQGLTYEDTILGEVELRFPFTGTYENPPNTPFGWDFNSDNFFDPQFHYNYEEGGVTKTEAWFKQQWPVNYYNDDNYTDYMFHCDYIRTTQDNDGFVVAVWVDSYKDHAAREGWTSPIEGENYENYRSAPELMISASKDHGNNWSIPFSISSYSHPDLFTEDDPDRYPEYLYPADKVEILSENSFRLYMMSVTDYSYGTYSTITNGPVGSNLGAEIQYLALDFSLTLAGDQVVPPPNSETSQTLPPPQKLLSQNYPNPFNPTTTIRFNLPKAGNVKLDVYNIKGQHVKTLVDGFMNPDTHAVVWNGTDSGNQNVASGVYFYRLSANGQTETKKMLLMK